MLFVVSLANSNSNQVQCWLLMQLKQRRHGQRCSWNCPYFRVWWSLEHTLVHYENWVVHLRKAFCFLMSFSSFLFPRLTEEDQRLHRNSRFSILYKDVQANRIDTRCRLLAKIVFSTPQLYCRTLVLLACVPSVLIFFGQCTHSH